MNVQAGTYTEALAFPSPAKAFTLTGATTATTIVDGTGLAGQNGFRNYDFPTAGAASYAVQNATIRLLTLRNFAESGMNVRNGTLTNLTLEDVAITGNGRHGVHIQGVALVDGFTARRVNASGNNPSGGNGARGIWIIDGQKQNITIVDGTYSNNSLVGIDISDGNVTAATITGNTVVGNGDSGIGVLGAQGPDANLIANNTVTNNGRYGIEIKVPNGSGQASGAGSVVVENNLVSRTVDATDARDYAGIAVFRRSGTPLNADQPNGVVVRNNDVSGFRRKPAGSTGDGFGIVVEGMNMTVSNNTLANNDVGVQAQGGNTADQQSTPFFDRGNASSYSGTITLNGIDSTNTIGLRNPGGTTPSISAERNAWDSPTGPTTAGNPGGTGASVVGSVDFSPWLGDPSDAQPAAIGFQPNLTPLYAVPTRLTVNQCADRSRR